MCVLPRLARHVGVQGVVGTSNESFYEGGTCAYLSVLNNHQAVEAKESVPIQNETVTLASISYQSFFLSYDKLSGMTGTAETELAEFNNIYNLAVAVRLRRPTRLNQQPHHGAIDRCVGFSCCDLATVVGGDSISHASLRCPLASAWALLPQLGMSPMADASPHLTHEPVPCTPLSFEHRS
jgi:hypothetical protein